VDVDAGAGVADEHAVARMARHAAVEHPAVFAVAPAQPVFDLEGLAQVEGAHAGVEPAGEILRVHAARPAVAERLLGGEAGEFEPGPAQILAGHVRARDPDHRRNALVEQPGFRK
jgi:hypothetical protein